MSKNNEYMAEYVKKRYIKLKLDAIAYKGGKCQVCGYDKCPAALQFHHRDPKVKELEWRYLRRRSIEFIHTELDKCDLLCANHHAELHYDARITENAIAWLESRGSNVVKYAFEIDGRCLQCSGDFKRTHDTRRKKYCSHKCSSIAQIRIKWPSDEMLVSKIIDIGIPNVASELHVSIGVLRRKYNKILKCNAAGGSRTHDPRLNLPL